MSNTISVIVPVYNVEPYLERCIDSIIKQTYQDLELILIDDGSTDNSGKICDDFQKRDPRIIVIHQRNQGVSAARNAGLDVCTGGYISFVDPDDWIEKDMYLEMIKAIVQTDADFAVCNETLAYCTDNKVEITRKNHWKYLNTISKVDRDGAFRIIFANTGILCNKVFTRTLFSQKRFDISRRYGEDFVLLSDILENVDSAVIVPCNYYNYYYDRPGNVVSTTIDERAIELLGNAEKVYIDCAKRGYSDVGIRRISIAISEVMNKIPRGKWYSPDYKEYTLACVQLSKVPRKKEIITYILNGVYSFKDKGYSALMCGCFPLWLLTKYYLLK